MEQASAADSELPVSGCMQAKAGHLAGMLLSKLLSGWKCKLDGLSQLWESLNP